MQDINIVYIFPIILRHNLKTTLRLKSHVIRGKYLKPVIDVLGWNIFKGRLQSLFRCWSLKDDRINNCLYPSYKSNYVIKSACRLWCFCFVSENRRQKIRKHFILKYIILLYFYTVIFKRIIYMSSNYGISISQPILEKQHIWIWRRKCSLLFKWKKEYIFWVQR